MSSICNIKNQETKTMPPIIGTLRSTIFEVRCEETGDWIIPIIKTIFYPKDSTEWQEKDQYKLYEKFYKVEEENNRLRVTSPTGFWLKDGSLVSTRSTKCSEIENIEAAYYGERSEILDRGRRIKYILDGDFTVLPKN